MDRILSPRAFTAKAKGIQNVLSTPATVRPAFDPLKTEESQRPEGCQVVAIWDTGATGSVITQKVVDACGLKQTGLRNVRGVHGASLRPTYLVNLEIPPNVGFPGVPVTLGDLGSEVGLLIGMDIINLGDFAVSNYGGKTMFSFRYPSVGNIDFANDARSHQALLKPGRNDPCPCGSTKKFKKCCGKNV
jgi:hypothetical protein